MAAKTSRQAFYTTPIWNHKGKLLRVIKKTNTKSYVAVDWHPQKKQITALSEGSSEDLLWGIDWSPDGQYVVTSSEKGEIKIWSKDAILIKEIRRNDS